MSYDWSFEDGNPPSPGWQMPDLPAYTGVTATSCIPVEHRRLTSLEAFQMGRWYYQGERYWIWYYGPVQEEHP